MGNFSTACCRISSEINVNGGAVRDQAVIAHCTGQRHYAATALKDGREFVASLTKRLDELEAVLEESDG